MSFETWLAFAAASTALVMIPGPTVLLVVSYALGQGWRAALPMAVGVALGDFTSMTLSLLGVGALLAASATLYSLVKWAGAAYLVYLGIKLFRAGGTLDAEPRTNATPGLKMLDHAWLVTSLNPKGILFAVAFFPQFIDPSSPFLPQVVILQATFIVLASVNAFAYAGFASQARHLVRSGRTIAAMNKAGGAMLIGAGVATVAVRGS